MLKLFHIQAVICSLLLVSCAELPVRAQSGEPVFAVTTKNAEDQVDIQYENGIAYVDVQSPTGIGSAAFELESGSMPEEIVLRLYLKGLEEFRLTSTEGSIGASVSSGYAPTIQQRIISPGSESPILPGHPLWMGIEVISEQPDPEIPLQEGYFEVVLPGEFLRKAGTSFEIEWIDFYR